MLKEIIKIIKRYLKGNCIYCNKKLCGSEKYNNKYYCWNCYWNIV